VFHLNVQTKHLKTVLPNVGCCVKQLITNVHYSANIRTPVGELVSSSLLKLRLVNSPFP